MLRSIPARIVLLQFAIGAAGSALWFAASGPRAALAALAGGTIGAALSLYFAIQFMARAGADPRRLLQALMRAEAMKLLLAAALFAVAARLFSDTLVPLLTTFIAGLSVYWFALLWKTD